MTKTVNFKPNGNRVLVLVDEAEGKSKGGIIIPDSVKEKPRQGTIVAIGTGTEKEPMLSEVGDRIIFGKYSGNEIIVDGIEYSIMRQDDLIGKFTPTDSDNERAILTDNPKVQEQPK